uniref:Uncharacterized protein n=1 Tax=Knipowitschia caucasica TaxID=637954 RepID=A0AAV2JCQ2_KNICA
MKQKLKPIEQSFMRLCERCAELPQTEWPLLHRGPRGLSGFVASVTDIIQSGHHLCPPHTDLGLSRSSSSCLQPLRAEFWALSFVFCVFHRVCPRSFIRRGPCPQTAAAA